MDNYHYYLSPYTWRYASHEMREIWSEIYKRRLWRFLWVSLAEVQAEFNLLSADQVADLREHMDQIDMPLAIEIEAQIHHDLMAELRTFAEQASLGGGVLHLGATSADIEDNADALRLRQALDFILGKLRLTLLSFADQIENWANLPVMAFTHLQPAEPTTLGYRLAVYAQDLLMDWEDLNRERQVLRGKGFKGAVGTGASFGELIGSENLADFESRLSGKLDLQFFPVASQVYPRKQEYRIISALAGMGSSLYKFAFDLRLLQSPPIGELAEPFGAKQIGSSAMPFKRNPINAEKLDSLARTLAQMPRIAWDNAAHSALERTLDDSADRRSLLPEVFLIADELLITSVALITGLVVNKNAVDRNLAQYGPFAGTERLMVALGKIGADRQAMHERLREHSMHAWAAIQEGEENPLIERVCREPEFLAYLEAEDIRQLLDPSRYLGDAPARALALSQKIRSAIE